MNRPMIISFTSLSPLGLSVPARNGFSSTSPSGSHKPREPDSGNIHKSGRSTWQPSARSSSPPPNRSSRSCPPSHGSPFPPLITLNPARCCSGVVGGGDIQHSFHNRVSTCSLSNATLTSSCVLSVILQTSLRILHSPLDCLYYLKKRTIVYVDSQLHFWLTEENW
jgi:hypothetical protein